MNWFTLKGGKEREHGHLIDLDVFQNVNIKMCRYQNT
jgi:hypothetical protein